MSDWRLEHQVMAVNEMFYMLCLSNDAYEDGEILHTGSHYFNMRADIEAKHDI